MAALMIVGIRNLPVDFHSLLQCRRIPCLPQCRFLLPEERVKGTRLSPEVTILSRLALRIIREKDFLVPEEKETGLAINSQAISNREHLSVMDVCKITHIDLGTLAFLRIYMIFKILIISLISLLCILQPLMIPMVNPEAHRTMAE
tara:strand:+ start:250 stop:687 length:438 start_codon:yes stop_codon:yes gene_type:complete